MRQTSLILTTALISLSGCIIYDSDCYDDNGDGCRTDWGDDWGDCTELDADGNCMDDGDVDPGDSAEPVIPVELAFSPDHAEQGEVFAAYINLVEGELDLSAAQSITLFGDATVLAMEAQPGQLVTILSVAPDAALGPVDLIVNLPDGDGEIITDAFTIFATGSGNAARDGECE